MDTTFHIYGDLNGNDSLLFSGYLKSQRFTI
jgi:hypothetical protein